MEDLRNSFFMTIEEFHQYLKKSCDQAVGDLKSTWLPQCATIVANHKEDIELMMPNDMVS